MASFEKNLYVVGIVCPIYSCVAQSDDCSFCRHHMEDDCVLFQTFEKFQIFVVVYGDCSCVVRFDGLI